MRGRLKLFHLLPLALLAHTADGCSRVRPARQQSAVVAARQAAPAAPPQSPAPTPSPDAFREDGERYFKDSIKFGGGLRFGEKAVEVKNEKYKYEINFTYPQLEGAGGGRVEDFNRVVAAMVNREVKEFRGWHRGAQDYRPRPPYWEDVYESLDGQYDVAYATDEFISIRFDTYTYGLGAAHSVQQFRVVNFDLAAGRQLKLSDLFRPGSRHLRFIADFCINELRRQSKAKCLEQMDGRDCEQQHDFWLPEYVAPKPANYANWNLTRAGLLMSFDACRLAGCAAGEREVLIPYADLKNLSPAEGIIARLADGRDQ